MICPCGLLWAILAGMSTSCVGQGFWLHMDFTPPQGVAFVRFWMCKSAGVLWHWFQAFPYFFLMWHDVVWCGMMWFDVAWCELGFSDWPAWRGCICKVVSVLEWFCALKYVSKVFLFFHTLCENMGASPLSLGHSRDPRHLCGAYNTLQTYEALKTCKKTPKDVY